MEAVCGVRLESVRLALDECAVCWMFVECVEAHCRSISVSDEVECLLESIPLVVVGVRGEVVHCTTLDTVGKEASEKRWVGSLPW